MEYSFNSVVSLYPIGEFTLINGRNIKIIKIEFKQQKCKYSFEYLVEREDLTRVWVEEHELMTWIGKEN